MLSRPQGHSAAGRIKLIEDSSDPILNRTRDLPVCSSVPFILVNVQNVILAVISGCGLHVLCLERLHDWVTFVLKMFFHCCSWPWMAGVHSRFQVTPQVKMRSGDLGGHSYSIATDTFSSYPGSRAETSRHGQMWRRHILLKPQMS
jgi:hypothetical protein